VFRNLTISLSRNFWFQNIFLSLGMILIFRPNFFGYLASPDSEFYMGYVQFPYELHSRLGDHLANSPYSNYFWSRIPVIGPSHLFSSVFGIELGYTLQRFLILNLVLASSRHALQKFTSKTRAALISILVVANSVFLTALGMEYPTGIGFAASLALIFLMLGHLTDFNNVRWRNVSIGFGMCIIFWSHTAFVLFWLPIILLFGLLNFAKMKLNEAILLLLQITSGFFASVITLWIWSQALYGNSNPLSNIYRTSKELQYVFSQFAPGWSDAFPFWNGSIALLAPLASFAFGVALVFSKNLSVRLLAQFITISFLIVLTSLLLVTNMFDLVFLRNWLQYSLIWTLSIPIAAFGSAVVLNTLSIRQFAVGVSTLIGLTALSGFIPEPNSVWRIFPHGAYFSIVTLSAFFVLASTFRFFGMIQGSVLFRVGIVAGVLIIPFTQMVQNTQEEFIPSGAPAAIWNDAETSSIMDYGDVFSGTNQDPNAYFNATEINSWIFSELPEYESFSVHLGIGTDLKSNISARMLLYPTNGINLNEIKDIERFRDLGYMNSVMILNDKSEKDALTENFKTTYAVTGMLITEKCKSFLDSENEFKTLVCILTN
jgi:hypothetical protein